MWELIRINKRRSMVLVFVMLLVLLVLGFAIGAAFVPSVGATRVADGEVVPGFRFDPTGGFLGMGVAFCIWMVQSLVAYYQGDKILLRVSGARRIEKADHPLLFNVVEEMTIASRLPKMPDVYIIDDPALNAFATGRKPENAAVAVTSGLLAKLNRDQLQGVVAHEISHVVHRDVLFMTMVGIMLGTIVMMSEIFLRAIWHGSASRRYGGNRSSKGGGAAQVVVFALVIVLAILAPLLAQLIYFAASRRREYLADAGAAVYTRYPEGLASALEVLARDTHRLQTANRATAPLFIINPLHKPGKMALNLTATHPPIDERIRILRSIAGGVSYARYQEAWRGEDKSASLPDAALSEKDVPLRTQHPGTEKQDARQRTRDASDALRKVNQFVFLPCVCGMKIKLPPDFKRDNVDCPRCKRHLEVPVAKLAALAVVADSIVAETNAHEAPPLEVTHEPGAWQSVKCACGGVVNLAPNLAARFVRCASCGRKINVN